MRKFLIALTALAGVISASYFAYSTPAPLIGPATGCMEANQLLNCLNSQVINLLRGAGQTAPVSVGSFGTGSAANAANLTLNTQGGVATFTAVTIAANTTVSQTILNSLVTANSACVATLVADSSAAASFPYIRSLVPTAGTLTVNMSNVVGAATTGSSNFGIAFWCAN